MQKDNSRTIICKSIPNIAFHESDTIYHGKNLPIFSHFYLFQQNMKLVNSQKSSFRGISITRQRHYARRISAVAPCVIPENLSVSIHVTRFLRDVPITDRDAIHSFWNGMLSLWKISFVFLFTLKVILFVIFCIGKVLFSHHRLGDREGHRQPSDDGGQDRKLLLLACLF